MNFRNVIENSIRQLQTKDICDFEFESLYKDIKDDKVKTLFTWIHGGYIKLFGNLNERLPTGENGAHFWAAQSRDLIFLIDTTFECQKSLKNTEFAFEIDKYYLEIMNKCKAFLSPSGGSKISSYMKKIELYYTEPIFCLKDNITIDTVNHSYVANLKCIGEGSYAKVYKFKDSYYDKYFALKRAKNDLESKEIERFRREFEQMHELRSPYILEVYSFNYEKNEYIMENMDYTLEKYISLNNTKISLALRKSIVLQLIKAYSYIHSKGIFHRDVSPKNTLIKEFDDTIVVKISDFGLVKIKDSDLTSYGTDFKGSFNDPALRVEGFGNYNLLHEIYALTLLFTFILTGKINFESIKDKKITEFLKKGTNPDKSKRFQSLTELKDAFMQCI